MDVMGTFGYSKKIRWCCNLKFEYAFDGLLIFLIVRYLSTRSTMGMHDAIFYCECKDFFMEKTMIKSLWCHVLNGSISLKLGRPICAHHLVTFGKKICLILSGTHHLIESNVILYKWNYLFLLIHYVDKTKRSSDLNFNRLFRLGVLKVSDVIDNASQSC